MSNFQPATAQHQVPVDLLNTAKWWIHKHIALIKHVARVTAIASFVFIVLNVGLYAVQRGRLALFTTIDGKSYSLVTYSEAKRRLTGEHAGALLSLKVPTGKTVSLNAHVAGISIDPDETLKRLSIRSGWERIPLVFALDNLFITLQPNYSIQQEILAASVAPYIVNESLAPKNAAISISPDLTKTPIITPSAKGYELNAAVAADQITDKVLSNDFSVKVVRKTVVPEWTEQDLLAFMPVVEAARRTSITVQSDDQKVDIAGEQLAAMLEVDTNSSTLKVTLDKPALQAFLEAQAHVFYTAPVSTHTVLQDGIETNRTGGTPGKKLDVPATSTLVIEAFEQGVLASKPMLSTVLPDVIAKRTYSNTDNGLYKMIEDFAASHGGYYKVAAVELEGSSNRSAFYHADDSIVTASTFKVFVAYSILQKIQDGSLTLDSLTPLGSVDYCMRQMIIISDNECASAFQDILGWSALDTKLHNDGFAATNLNNYYGGHKHSTARDEMKLLTQLYFNELTTPSSKDYLFNLMKQQIYRQGIVAGSHGSAVADKVGILDSWYHDIGIVYSPKSTYALVILTDGAGGFGNIKALSGEIYDFYNQ